ncbi:hypothetical protein BMI79_09390 [Serratia oryzae]|uniref:Uncharacterized protein n=2 Tax=Serratia oryzae TaxID=2034155 RepID=A0A1S8CLT7_9GAMM|nr:hypothetical protein BMI79_09390 [Serratia oryzae]
MLCHDCEQLFSSNFEQYGISLLRRSKNIVKGNKNIIVYNYQHDRFYLYCLSIFWRMAQSKLDEFKNVLFPPRVSDIIRNCLLMNTLAINERMDINEIMRINIIKIYDPFSEKRTYYIQNILCPCHTDYTNNEYKISFLAEGLFYTLRLDLNKNNFEKNKNKGLPLGKALKIKKYDYREITELHYSIDCALDKTRKYPFI